MEQKEEKFVSLISDTTFKYLYKNEETRYYLESIILNKTGIDLNGFTLTSEEDNTGSKIKTYRMDLVLCKDNEIIIIEMNRYNSKSSEIKGRQYLYRKAGSRFDKGEKYSKQVNVKLIMFNNYYNKSNEDIKIVNYCLCDTKHNLKIDDIEIYEIYLPIFHKMCYDKCSIIDKRLWLFSCKSFKEMREKVIDEDSLKIIEELERLSMNDKFIDEYDYENVQRKLMNSMKDEGYEEGIKIGKIEGEKQGEKNKSIDIARNMLKENVDINIIVKCTGLTKEEIETLK